MHTGHLPVSCSADSNIERLPFAITVGLLESPVYLYMPVEGEITKPGVE